MVGITWHTRCKTKVGELCSRELRLILELKKKNVAAGNVCMDDACCLKEVNRSSKLSCNIKPVNWGKQRFQIWFF